MAYHGAARFTEDIDGMTFAEAPGGVVQGRYGSVEVTFIGRDDLIRNKRASGRHRDLGDVENPC